MPGSNGKLPGPPDYPGGGSLSVTQGPQPALMIQCSSTIGSNNLVSKAPTSSRNVVTKGVDRSGLVSTAMEIAQIWTKGKTTRHTYSCMLELTPRSSQPVSPIRRMCLLGCGRRQARQPKGLLYLTVIALHNDPVLAGIRSFSLPRT